MFEEPESGCLWERALWRGICPRWNDPKVESVAESLATRIINNFNNYDTIVFEGEDEYLLRTHVGSRTTYGGRMYYSDEANYIM